MAKLRSLTFQEKSKLINSKTYNIWDESIHQKLKYYIDTQNFKDEDTKDLEEKFKS